MASSTSSEITIFVWRHGNTKRRLLRAKIAVALHDELGRVPTTEEVEQVFLLTRVMYRAVLGLHYRKEQRQTGQLAIF